MSVCIKCKGKGYVEEWYHYGNRSFPKLNQCCDITKYSARVQELHSTSGHQVCVDRSKRLNREEINKVLNDFMDGLAGCDDEPIEVDIPFPTRDESEPIGYPYVSVDIHPATPSHAIFNGNIFGGVTRDSDIPKREGKPCSVIPLRK